MARETIKVKTFLTEAIRHRYASDSKIGSDNKIISQLFDIDSNDTDVVLETLESKGTVFNPNLSLMNIGLNEILEYNTVLIDKYPEYILNPGFKEAMIKAGIPSKYLTKNFASKTLKKEFAKLAEKELTLVVVGYGGAMTNLLYNLYILSYTFGIYPLFKKIIIFENDNWSLTNILRIGKPVMHKAFSRFQVDDSVQRPVLKKLFLFDDERILGEEVELNFEYFDKAKYQNIIKNEGEDIVIIGAPDFDTRKELAENNANFLMLGHINNSVSISKNPSTDGTVTETYGSIEIPFLLMNLWAGTYKLIDILNSDEYKTAENNTNLYQFDFDSLNEKDIEKIKKKFVYEFESDKSQCDYCQE